MHRKANHPFLPNNESQSIARLNKQITRFKRNPPVLEEYHKIIQKQLNDRILQEAPPHPTGKRVFYNPHKTVIKENKETTKTRRMSMTVLCGL